MNKKEKKEKKAIISEAIDLGNGRYKDEEVDYNTRVDMLLNKITSLYNLSKTNDFEFSDAFSDSEKQLILNLFDIKTKKLTK